MASPPEAQVPKRPFLENRGIFGLEKKGYKYLQYAYKWVVVKIRVPNWVP